MKSIYFIIFLLIIILAGSFVYYKENREDQIKNKEQENIIDKANSACQLTDCAPYLSPCRHWRSVSYDPYKSCYYDFLKVIDLNDTSSCKKIVRNDLAAYCLSLTSVSECYLFSEGNRTLQAICNINSLGNELYEENGTYIIKSNCAPSGGSCSSVFWRVNP